MIPETFPSLYGKIHFPFAEFLGQGQKRNFRLGLEIIPLWLSFSLRLSLFPHCLPTI